jgi:hypothetical protein
MSNSYDRALDEAIDRDLRDGERLDHFATVITTAMDAIAHDVHPLEHPHGKWHPTDLMNALQHQLRHVQIERGRLGGPVVVE